MNSASDNRRIVKNTILLYVRMLLVMIVSLYTVRVVLNVLGEEDYGIYNVVGGIVVMFSFLGRSLASSSQRYFAFEIGRGNQERLKNIFSITLLLYFIIVIIVAALSESIGMWFLKNKMTIPEERMCAATWVFQFSIISFCYTLLMTPYQAMLIAREDMNIYAFIGVFEALLCLGVGLSIRYMTFDRLIAYGLLMLFSVIVVNSIYLLYSIIKYKESRVKWYWDSNLAKEISSYSGWNILGAIANVARSQGINILINMFFNPAINAARGLAYQVSNALNSFASNFYTAVRPQVTKKYAIGDDSGTLRLVFSSSKLSYYLILFLAIPVIVFVHPILEFWLVEIPQSTELFVCLVIIIALIDSLSNPLMTLVQATGNVKNYQIIVSSLLILNLPISWVFLKIGYPAEYTMFVAIVLSLFLLVARVHMLKKLVDFPAQKYYKDIIAKVLLTSILCYTVSFFLKHFLYDSSCSVIMLFVSIFLSVALDIILIFYIGLSKFERTSIISLVKSKFKSKS